VASAFGGPEADTGVGRFLPSSHSVPRTPFVTSSGASFAAVKFANAVFSRSVRSRSCVPDAVAACVCRIPRFGNIDDEGRRERVVM
jgi:hypothetical protein